MLKGVGFLWGVCAEAKVGQRFSARGAHVLPDFSAGECARQKTYPFKLRGARFLYQHAQGRKKSLVGELLPVAIQWDRNVVQLRD